MVVMHTCDMTTLINAIHKLKNSYWLNVTLFANYMVITSYNSHATCLQNQNTISFTYSLAPIFNTWGCQRIGWGMLQML